MQLYIKIVVMSNQLARQASCMTNYSQYAIKPLDNTDPWRVLEPLVRV